MKLTGRQSKSIRGCTSMITVALTVVTAALIGGAQRSEAQTPLAVWTTPTNISNSGGTTRPLIAAEPDGTLHTLWWDVTEGELYAHTISATSTTWTSPIVVPAIVGQRLIDQQTNRELISPPTGTVLLATSRGNAQAFWYDTDNQLRHAQTQAGNWTDSTVLSTSANAFDVIADITGTLHLAYIKPTPTTGAPAGLYYRTKAGASWGQAVVVHESSYFRSVTSSDLHVSVASVREDTVLIAWDDPQLGESVYARSTDGGATWSAPTAVANTRSRPALRARLATAPRGKLLMISQDVSLGGCGFLQQQSADGGATWSAPERVLTSITRCEEHWKFASANDGRLWLIGRLAPANPADIVSANTLAAWDGQSWSQVNDVGLSFTDVTTNRAVTLDCMSIAIAGATAGLLGCDSIGDIWTARNAVDLNNLSIAPAKTWSDLTSVSDRTASVAVDGLMAAATDREGAVFAVWSQPDTGNVASDVLFGSQRGDNGWTQVVRILGAPETSTSNLARAEQPAITIDERDRIHVAWNSGANGPVYYAWSSGRDFNTPTGWSQPVELPNTAPTANWPDMAIDLNGNTLYVTYAAPFNEGRGIYITRSADDGTTWSTPTRIFDAEAAHWDSVDKPRVVFDRFNQTLHVVWLRANLPGGLGTQAVYYTRSSDHGQIWSEPSKLAEGGVDWPRIAISNSGQIYVAWTESSFQEQTDSAAPLSVWGSLSTDGGSQWTAPEKIAGFDHVSGPIGLATDRGGKVYLGAVGQTVSGESALLYAERDTVGWNKFEKRALNQTAQLGNSATIALAPDVGQLSVLLRLWMYDRNGRGQFQIAAIERAVEVKAAAQVPTAAPTPTATPRPIETPAPTPTPRPELPTVMKPPAVGAGSTSPLIVGGVLAAFVVIVAMARTLYVTRR